MSLSDRSMGRIAIKRKSTRMHDTFQIAGQEIRVKGRLLRIAQLEADKYHVVEHPETMLRGLRNSGRRVDLFTFLQKLPERTPEFHYPMEWDNLAVLPVSTFENWWNQQLGFKARNKAKQALKKGVTIREVPFDDTLVEGIWKVYNECPVRQGRPFRHFGKSLHAIRREEATFLDTSIFIGAYLNDALIGFIKLTHDAGRTQAGLMNIVSMVQHRDKAPTNALLAEAVRACASRNIPHLVYSNFSYGRKQSDSLSDFKERNGFQRYDVPRYYVPLTVFGKLALRLGLHKNWADRIPEPMVAKLRDIRNQWYNRKLETTAEAS